MEAQIDYIALDKPLVAVRIAEAVIKNTQLLVAFPHMGRPGRVFGTRELVLARTPFLVVYRVSSIEVEVIRFLHGAQQYPG
jgi:toxin ParE1/3/4